MIRCAVVKKNKGSNTSHWLCDHKRFHLLWQINPETSLFGLLWSHFWNTKASGAGWKEEKGVVGAGGWLVLIREVKAKEVWPCPLWALSWNAMWTLRRQLLEPCQGPLTLRRFLFLCLCPQTQQWGGTCCLPPPPPQPQTSPAASPFLRFALILSLSLTCSLWHSWAR